MWLLNMSKIKLDTSFINEISIEYIVIGFQNKIRNIVSELNDNKYNLMSIILFN